MDDVQVSIRLACDGDAEIIARMSRDLIEQGLGWSWTEQRVRKAIAHRDTLSVVALRDNQLVGFAIAQFGDEQAHLSLLAVHSAHQRTGIGRQLIEWVTESALVAGIHTLHLELRLRNVNARGFYRQIGFRDTVVVPNYYRGVETAVRMSRDITRQETSSSKEGI